MILVYRTRRATIQEMKALTQRFESTGLRLNLENYTALISYYYSQKQLEEAILLYRMLEEARLEPDQRLVSIMIRVYCYDGTVDRAMDFMKKWSIRTGNPVNVYHYTSLIEVIHDH